MADNSMTSVSQTKPSISEQDVNSASGTAKSQDENLPLQGNDMAIREVSTDLIWNAEYRILLNREIKALKTLLRVSHKKKTQP